MKTFLRFSTRTGLWWRVDLIITSCPFESEPRVYIPRFRYKCKLETRDNPWSDSKNSDKPHSGLWPWDSKGYGILDTRYIPVVPWPFTDLEQLTLRSLYDWLHPHGACVDTLSCMRRHRNGNSSTCYIVLPYYIISLWQWQNWSPLFVVYYVAYISAKLNHRCSHC